MCLNFSLYKLNCIYSLQEMWGWQGRLDVLFNQTVVITVTPVLRAQAESTSNTTGLTAHSSHWNLHVAACSAPRWTWQRGDRGRRSNIVSREARPKVTSCDDGNHLTCVSLPAVERKLDARWGRTTQQVQRMVFGLTLIGQNQYLHISMGESL